MAQTQKFDIVLLNVSLENRCHLCKMWVFAWREIASLIGIRELVVRQAFKNYVNSKSSFGKLTVNWDASRKSGFWSRCITYFCRTPGQRDSEHVGISSLSGKYWFFLWFSLWYAWRTCKPWCQRVVVVVLHQSYNMRHFDSSVSLALLSCKCVSTFFLDLENVRVRCSFSSLVLAMFWCCMSCCLLFRLKFP